MKRGVLRIYTSWYLPEDDRWVVEELGRLAKLEGVSVNALVSRFVKEGIARHRDGNPQTTLIPRVHPYVNPMTERRAELLADLLADIRSHPGEHMNTYLGDWGRVHGVQEKTVRTYLQQLSKARKIRIRGVNVYPREGP